MLGESLRMTKAGALTILLLSTTYASPLLHLNYEESNLGKEKSSGLDATEKADVTSGEAGTSRYSFIWTSPLAWLNSLSLVNNDGYYLTTAQKTKDNVFFNGTTVYPISFALAGAGMIAYAAAYLVSQLPSSGKYRAGFRSDEYYDDIDDYSFDRDHDSDIYAFEDDDKDYDYQYPDKEDGWNYAGTSQRVKKDRIGGGGGGRRPRWQRRRPFRRHRAPGLLERIASFVSKPVGAMARVSHAVNNPGGFLKQFANRYDAYWEARRGGGNQRWEQSNRGQPRPAAHSRYWQQPQYRTDETAGPQIPLQESFQNEAEGGADEEQQQLTGGWESSADSFVFGKQIH